MRSSATLPPCSSAAAASWASCDLGLTRGTEDRQGGRGRGRRRRDRAVRGRVRWGARTRAPAGARLAARRPAGGSQRQGDHRGPTRRIRMAVVKIIELVGSSKTSTDDAAKQALLQAQGSLRNIRAVDIVSTGIRGENLDEYRAHVRVAFLIEGTEVD